MKKTKKKTKAKAVKKTAKKSCRKNKKGFTLIELLVVVAIIGILAGIVVISTTSARNRTVRASLLSTMATIATTASVCVHEDGTVQDPLNVTTGTGAICSLADIDETYPALAPEVVNAGYQYAADMTDTTLTATDGTNIIVTCAVDTASCRFP